MNARHPAPPYLTGFLYSIFPFESLSLLHFSYIGARFPFLDADLDLVTGGHARDTLTEGFLVYSRFLDMFIAQDSHITFNRNAGDILCRGGRGMVRISPVTGTI